MSPAGGERSKFSIHVNSEAFTYLGVELKKGSNGIYYAQNDYLNEKLHEIEIDSSRQEEKQSPVNDEEMKKLRSAVGKLNWLATQTRPDLAYEVCEISTRVKNATVELMMKTNKVIKKAKYNTVFLYYPILDLNNLVVRCYTDASFGNLPDGGSQGGAYIELVSGQNCAPIEWQSKRLTRTAKSTLAAETIAMVDGTDAAIVTSKLLAEIIHNEKKSIPVEVITDNLSLFEAAHSTTSTTDRRLRIEMSIIRENMSRNQMKLKWVRTDHQLADCLTKKGSDPRKLVAHVTGKLVV